MTQRHGLPNVLNKKPKFPSRMLYYSVSVALQAPPAIKIQQQENQQLELDERFCAAAVMKSRNSEERAKEVVNANKQLDAGRARSGKAILDISCKGHAEMRVQPMLEQ